MIKSYFKIAWRNLHRSKLFSFVNIFGLAIGLTAFWMIILYVGYELSYDRFHAKAENIYRVAQHATWASGNMDVAISSAPFAQALVDDYPEIKEAVRINPEGGGVVSYKDKRLIVHDIYFADRNIFKIFSFKFLYGNPASSLKKPQSIVLTKTLAEKLFGDPSLALGERIYFENDYENIVTGVIEDIPGNSHLNFSALRSLPSNYMEDWQAFNLYTYILLNENAGITRLEAKISRFYEKHLKSEMGELDYALELQPLTSIHLHSHLDYEISRNGDINNIYIFIAAAVLILIIAAINYINLTVARSAVRVREVGVRKIVGAHKFQLTIMFCCEALLVSAMAMLLAVFFADLLLPFIKEISGIDLSLWQFGMTNTLLAGMAITLIVGIVCGVYPAFFLSGLKTVFALKGQIGNVSTNITIRKSMVVFQFVVAIIMISGSWIIFDQLQFLLKKDLGFNKDQVITFHVSSHEVRRKIAFLKEQLLQNPHIKGVAVASNPIGNNNIGTNGMLLEKENGGMSSSTFIVQQFSVGEDFMPTLEIELVAGRNFAHNRLSDTYASVLVNETFVKEARWKHPLGKIIQNSSNNEENARAKIVGVVKDFHTYSLQHPIAPLVIYKASPEDQDNVYVKILPNRTREVLSYINKAYGKLDPSTPLEFHFLDQNFAEQYQGEQRQGKLLLIFTLLAILLALLGLFGLTAFSMAQRNKEIGVRKVLGASVLSLIALLSKDFIKLVMLAFLIASPIAWFAMRKWLQNFAYRIAIEWWMFPIIGVLIITVAGITISYQSIKTASTNPVNSIKSE